MNMPQYPWHLIGAVESSGLAYRSFRRGLVCDASDLQDAKAKISAETADFPHLFTLDNFRRGDEKVRAYILSAILAHRDASVDAVRETAVLDFGRCGCHEQNRRYFDDYRTHGRHLGRGHLFVGTLPTTPPCEAAISLKLSGPCYYLDSLDRFPVLWDEISVLLETRGVKRVLAFHFRPGRIDALLAESGSPTSIPDGMEPAELIRQPGVF